MERGSLEENFEGLEMQKWNIPNDTAQRADEKNLCNLIYSQIYGH